MTLRLHKIAVGSRLLLVLGLTCAMATGQNQRVTYERFDLRSHSNETNPASSYALLDLGEASHIVTLTNSGDVLFYTPASQPNEEGAYARWHQGVREPIGGNSPWATDMAENGTVVGSVARPDRPYTYFDPLFNFLPAFSSDTAAQWVPGSSSAEYLDAPSFPYDIFFDEYPFGPSGPLPLIKRWRYSTGTADGSSASTVDSDGTAYGSALQQYVESHYPTGRVGSDGAPEIWTAWASIANGFNLTAGSPLSTRTLTPVPNLELPAWTASGEQVWAAKARAGVVWTYVDTVPLDSNPLDVYLNGTLITSNPIDLNNAGVLLAEEFPLSTLDPQYVLIDGGGTETAVPQLPAGTPSVSYYLAAANHRVVSQVDANGQTQEVLRPQFLGGAITNVTSPMDILWEVDLDHPDRLRAMSIPSVFPTGTEFQFSSATHLNDHGVIACIARRVRGADGAQLPAAQQKDHAVLLLPVELTSKDRVLRGSIEIPEAWTGFALSFKNTTKNQDLGTFENLESGADTEVKIYDSPDDFFSDEEMEQSKNGNLSGNARNQKVTFAQDPANPRKLQFCAVFDDVGEIEVKLRFGPHGAEAIARHTLTADANVAEFINHMDARITSIEVPDAEELPLDLDGDGIPDGPSDDLIQARQAGSIAIPGALVSEDLEDHPLNLVLRINNDDDDGGGHPDNADAVIDPQDNDVSKLLLKRPGSLAGNSGTLTLTVSNPAAVRVFKSDGSAALSSYTVDLANPSGDLAGLATGSVPIYVEGLSAAADVIFTLTWRNAQDEMIASDSVHLTVASQYALLNVLGGIQAAYGGGPKSRMRSYAENGALRMEPLYLAPIGENPPLQHRALLSKALWDIVVIKTKVELAGTRGFVDGFWVALKGEKDAAVGVWTFFRDDPYCRAAAMYGAVKEGLGELKNVPAGQIPELFKTIATNLTADLYTAAENQLPWEPVTPNLSPDVLAYMRGFVAGTVAEGVAVSLLGVGVVTKTATVIKGIIATCKVGRYALTSLNALRKATARMTHRLMRLAKTKEGNVRIGAIAKRMEKVELPSGRKVPEVFEEGLRDKPELGDKVVESYHYHGQAIIDDARAATRLQKCVHSMAELQDIMGSGITDDMIEGFSLVQKKFFKEGVDDLDRWPDCKALWKDLDTVQTKGYRYVTQAEWTQIQANANKLPIHPSRGHYCTLDGGYTNGTQAKNALQLPLDGNQYIGRIEFDLAGVKNNVRVPFSANDDNKALFELLARDNPNFVTPGGGGGGTQFLFDGTEVSVTFQSF